MANPTSNFGWQMPTPTDLVTDLPADFEVFGQAVDTSMADLKGGTSGQILAKNSNTDMDFVWIANDQGDITGITASSPLTGGGTSGAVTIGILNGTTSNLGAVQLSDSTSSTSTTLAATANAVKTTYDLANGAIPKSLIDAAGDLIVGTAADTAGRLGIGTAGQVLKVNSGATALEWGTAGSAGKVLQVLQDTASTEIDNSTTTYAATGLSQAITPAATTSKVLVMLSIPIHKTAESADNAVTVRILRGGTEIVLSTSQLLTQTALRIIGNLSFVYLDSPSTTSSTTYSVEFKNYSNNNRARVCSDNTLASLVLMEIGA